MNRLKENLRRMPPFDAGLLSDGGGGDVEWWRDYIRALLEQAHTHYLGYVEDCLTPLRHPADIYRDQRDGIPSINGRTYAQPHRAWRCRRCRQKVDYVAFRCGCEKGASPWEPIPEGLAFRLAYGLFMGLPGWLRPITDRPLKWLMSVLPEPTVPPGWKPEPWPA